MDMSITDQTTNEALALETRAEAMQKDRGVATGLGMHSGRGNAEEQQLVHMQTLDDLFCLAESTRFSGAVVLAFVMATSG